MGRELDLLVAPLGGPVVAGDDPGPVDPPEVAVDERVAGLRLAGRALGQPDVPERVILPRVLLEEGVLVLGARLDLAPIAVQHVLARVDEPPRVRQGRGSRSTRHSDPSS